MEPAVVFDEVAARLGGVFFRLLPVAVMENFFLPARQDFPDLDLADVHAACEVAAVGRKRDADRPVVIVLIFAEQRHQLGPGGDFPDLDVLVVTPSGQHQAIGRQGQAAHVMVVPGEEQFQWLSGFRIPETNRAILAAGCEMLAVRSEGNGPDIMGMPAKRPEQPPGFDVPHPHVSIHAAAGERQTIGRIGNRPDTVRVSAKGFELSNTRFPVLEEIDNRLV